VNPANRESYLVPAGWTNQAAGYRARAVALVSGPRPVHALVVGLRVRIIQSGEDGWQREAADKRDD